MYFIKGMGNVAKNLLDVPPKDIAIPTIVLFELEVGIAESTSPHKRKTQLQDFIDIVNILSFGIDEARKAASIKAKLEKSGSVIGPYDIIIAATVLSQNGTLVTHNTAEFQRVESLKLVDWY